MLFGMYLGCSSLAEWSSTVRVVRLLQTLFGVELRALGLGSPVQKAQSRQQSEFRDSRSQPVYPCSRYLGPLHESVWFICSILYVFGPYKAPVQPLYMPATPLSNPFRGALEKLLSKGMSELGELLTATLNPKDKP